ncbi:MAG: secondary thiamine-phosphate synthase enzyme YjbQ [Deltaproteobacteria bacterium]|nr:secondary thiamine-phosphate synthase enzyme YjbQ [Deltaproteobacteria bacterium]
MDYKIENFYLSLKTSGNTDVIDITTQVLKKVTESGITEGQILLFVPGSTASITTIEYESGVVQDLKEAVERLAPEGIFYRHDARWGDGNGYAHVRAALLGPSLTVPLMDGHLVLGTWQQIVLVDFDNRPRDRKILVHISGISR